MAPKEWNTWGIKMKEIPRQASLASVGAPKHGPRPPARPAPLQQPSGSGNDEGSNCTVPGVAAAEAAGDDAGPSRRPTPVDRVLKTLPETSYIAAAPPAGGWKHWSNEPLVPLPPPRGLLDPSAFAPLPPPPPPPPPALVPWRLPNIGRNVEQCGDVLPAAATASAPVVSPADAATASEPALAPEPSASYSIEASKSSASLAYLPLRPPTLSLPQQPPLQPLVPDASSWSFSVMAEFRALAQAQLSPAKSEPSPSKERPNTFESGVIAPYWRHNRLNPAAVRLKAKLEHLMNSTKARQRLQDDVRVYNEERRVAEAALRGRLAARANTDPENGGGGGGGLRRAQGRQNSCRAHPSFGRGGGRLLLPQISGRADVSV